MDGRLSGWQNEWMAWLVDGTAGPEVIRSAGIPLVRRVIESIR